MRLKVAGGSTNYDGIYPISRSSYISIEKSKVSPTIQGINSLIDIRKGGVIDRTSSLVLWMVESVTPQVFKSAGGWFSVTEDFMAKYQQFWEIFGLTGKFRQASLYDLAARDENFVDFLQLIWLDLISEYYALQKDICKDMKDTIEAKLIMNLGVTPIEETVTEEADISVDLDTLDQLVGEES